MSFAKKKPKPNLDGIFTEPIGPVSRKRPVYGPNHYVLRVKPTVEVAKLTTSVIEPKSDVTTVPVTPKTKEPKPPKPTPSPKVTNAAREDKAYKPSQEEIARATDVLKELERSRVKAIPDTDPRSQEDG